MALDATTIRDVDRFELASIIAGLRLLQATPALTEGIDEIATDCGDFERLDAEQIDDLCERINTAAAYPWREVPEDDADTEAPEANVAALFEEIV